MQYWFSFSVVSLQSFPRDLDKNFLVFLKLKKKNIFFLNFTLCCEPELDKQMHMQMNMIGPFYNLITADVDIS